MIRALLVDDEAPARARMRRLLEATGRVEILAEASDGLQALEKIETLKPEVVFLDIEMPELDGLEVARTVGAHGPSIVFVTAYDEFALKAFETHAVDYLVKPVAEARLQATLQKLERHHERASAQEFSRLMAEMASKRSSTRLAVKSGNRYIVVDLLRVSAIVAKDHYAAIQVDGRELLSDDPLDILEKKLDAEKFMRIHRSAIVNVDFIQELEREGDRKFTAILSDASKTRVAVARERLDDVKKKLGI